MHLTKAQTLVTIGVLVVGPSCSSRHRAAADEAAEPAMLTQGTLKLGSTAFGHNGKIPKRFTCEGDDISPPLAWEGVPSGTKSLALIVDDPDAPDPKAPRTIWVHWVLYNMPPSAKGLDEGARTLPEGTRQGRNDWKRVGYGGPCPPIGRHRYFHRLYALDSMLTDLDEPSKTELTDAMKGHILDQTELIGTYEKSGGNGSP